MAMRKLGSLAISLSSLIVYCNATEIKEKLTPKDVAKEICNRGKTDTTVWNVCSAKTCVKTVGDVMSLDSKITLRGGTNIPLFGVGTYMLKSGPGTPTENVIKTALECGYLLVDTAEYYENEADVGRAAAASKVPREKLFIVTKLWDQGYDTCKESFAKSLQKLDMCYVDLYLIHSPLGGEVIDSYKAMLELKNDGLVKAVGVSNFGIRHLEELKKADLPAPEVNQIELHVFCKQEPIVEYCRKNNITVMGYTPLARGYYFSDPTLKKIADKHSKTPAQVMLRWSIQMAYITIPKTETLERITENADIFDFSLTNEEMEILNSLPNKPVTWNPVDSPWTG